MILWWIERVTSLITRCLTAVLVSAYLVTPQTDATAQVLDTGADKTGSDTTTTELTLAEKSLLRSFGPWPKTSPADPGNELSGLRWAEVVGETLFNDPNLSGSGILSCQSCHLKQLGFADGKPVATGQEKHVRNTQGLLDIGLQRWFGWDGGADSLWAATLRPMLSEIEMAGELEAIGNYLRSTDYVTDAFSKLNLTDANNETRAVLAAKAIAAYTRTLTSEPTPFDAYYQAIINNNSTAASNYPEAAKRGLKIFLGEANCHVCHFGPNFSNGEFHDTGRPFFTGVGNVDPGRYRGIQRVRKDRYNLLGEYNTQNNESEKLKTQSVKLGQSNFGEWRTPSLRNLTKTAPYTHDGSLPTLRAVVDAYADIDIDRLHANGESILNPLPLNDRQREDLVAFLESLTATH